MIADFETLCMWMFVVVDEIWQQVAPRFARPRLAPSAKYLLFGATSWLQVPAFPPRQYHTGNIASRQECSFDMF